MLQPLLSSSLSHISQWDRVRAETEARLSSIASFSKPPSSNSDFHDVFQGLESSNDSGSPLGSSYNNASCVDHPDPAESSSTSSHDDYHGASTSATKLLMDPMSPTSILSPLPNSADIVLWDQEAFWQTQQANMEIHVAATSYGLDDDVHGFLGEPQLDLSAGYDGSTVPKRDSTLRYVLPENCRELAEI